MPNFYRIAFYVKREPRLFTKELNLHKKPATHIYIIILVLFWYRVVKGQWSTIHRNGTARPPRDYFALNSQSMHESAFMRYIGEIYNSNKTIFNLENLCYWMSNRKNNEYKIILLKKYKREILRPRNATLIPFYFSYHFFLFLLSVQG